MDHSERGAKALEASDINTAIVSYTKALIEHPTSPDYFVQRSIAFTKLKPPRHDLALQDAELAILCGQSRGRRDKIQLGQHRRMVACYNLERYADAKLILDSMVRWRPKQEGKLAKKEQMEHDIWTSKINGKLKATPQEATIKEYPETKLPTDKELKKILQGQLRADDTFNYDGKPETGAVTDEPAKVEEVVAKPVATPKIRHEWYQNNQNVIVTIYAKGVPKDRAEISIEEDAISISFPHPADPASTFEFTADPLYGLIDVQASKSQIMSTKIELILAKATTGQKWAQLEGTETPHKVATAIAAPVQSSAPSYPSSSKTGPKNWDKLANELTKKPEKEEGVEDDGYDSDFGGDAVDGFFKKLYAGSDEATRRAMIKSFTESNGTALSTNWGDVGSRTVDPVKSKDDEDD